jgi:transcription elongation GreA/GreB family factor
MSRAFVKEPDGEQPEDLPELPLSPHPNYVTLQGLAQLRERLSRVQQHLTALPEDARQEHAQAAREQRWLQARIGSARLVAEGAQASGQVAIGATVRISDDDARSYTYRIVGEDEADPERGLVSWVSPLARALIGAKVGDVVTWKRPAGDLEVEVREIRYDTVPPLSVGG